MSHLESTLTPHYTAVRAVYDSAPFYAPGPYEQWLIARCLERIALQPAHALADIGGGSGVFSAKLKAAAGARWLSVVEPSAEMLLGAEANALVDEVVTAGALEWAEATSSDGRRSDRVLLKEVVHHIAADERARVFSLLRERRLAAEGQVTIVTRPQRDIDYPLFAAAREVWAKNQPSEYTLTDELQRAGFGRVEVHRCSYACEIPLDEWCELVRGRFWSTFAACSEAELSAGCEEIRAGAPEDGVLRFEDRLLLITASVQPSGA